MAGVWWIRGVYVMTDNAPSGSECGSHCFQKFLAVHTKTERLGNFNLNCRPKALFQRAAVALYFHVIPALYFLDKLKKKKFLFDRLVHCWTWWSKGDMSRVRVNEQFIPSLLCTVEHRDVDDTCLYFRLFSSLHGSILAAHISAFNRTIFWQKVPLERIDLLHLFESS